MFVQNKNPVHPQDNDVQMKLDFLRIKYYSIVMGGFVAAGRWVNAGDDGDSKDVYVCVCVYEMQKGEGNTDIFFVAHFLSFSVSTPRRLNV